jgi:glyoxylase-like metal-dependent hydrolase (beta-lactamase superfamily II)
VDLDERAGRVTKLSRNDVSDLFGDGSEEVRYEVWAPPAGGPAPGRVVVESRGRETARIDYVSIERGPAAAIPAGDRRRDRGRIVSPDEIVLREVEPRLFAADLDSINTRVFVAEFQDHVVVLEGAYGSRICDRIAAKVREKFAKPVRYFAFSHLHGQYVGGVRSWVAEGATVIVPPTTAPLVKAVVEAPHEFRPDALSREPKPLRTETVKERRRLEDPTNALEIFNIESDHTDEYFVFYFPGQKVLLTGDLLFYRPGKPLAGRSKKLCSTVAKLGLDVERYYATWPLAGYGTKNVVTRDEMREACEGDSK